MKALRLKLYQQTACYKKPFAFKVSETYPLPPYSTVKGMLHSVLEATTLIPMRISIQGNYDTIATDYQTHYFFKKDQTNEFALTIDGLGIEVNKEDITTMPIYMHVLYDVELTIHVQAEDEILNKLYIRLSSATTHLSLGRWEDLVRVDECEIVETVFCEEEQFTKHHSYVPVEMLADVTHFPYKLNSTYRIIKGVRVWEKIPVGYVLAGEPIEGYQELMKDPYGDLIFFP